MLSWKKIKRFLRPYRHRGYKSITSYWSCSKFAKIVRGSVIYPEFATMEEWDSIKKEFKSKHPIRYWISNKALNKIQNFIFYPYDVYTEIEHYISNKKSNMHNLSSSSLEEGRYYDLDYRITMCVFDSFKKFIEDEKAASFSGDSIEEKVNNFFNWSTGLTYDEDYFITVNKKMFGKPTPQAIYSKEMQEIYYWWENFRNLPDTMGEEESKKRLKLEKEYLIRLIKIKEHLWD